MKTYNFGMIDDALVATTRKTYEVYLDGHFYQTASSYEAALSIKCKLHQLHGHEVTVDIF